MLRFSALFALFAFLVASVSAETIVSDSLGNQIGLPLGGGNATGDITNTNSLVSTSPYFLYVYVNDGLGGTGDSGLGYNEAESFYFKGLQSNGLFGNATLLSSAYSSTFSTTGGIESSPPTKLLGNASDPNTAAGLYAYKFYIPVMGYVIVNLTYINKGPDPLPVVDLITISVYNPSSVVGDPQFVGLRGQSYQVHGIDGAVYNIISESNTQVNAKFVFLSEGECPVIGGVAEKNCWSHPGSYLGEMSFQQKVDGELHQALLVAGDAKSGFASIQLDGKTLSVGDTFTYGTFSVSYKTKYTVSITTENYSFELSNSDMFINQAVSSRVPLSKLRSHGLLGQTHSTKVYATAARYIEGEVDDYVIADNNIFGTDFAYNQF